MVHWYVSEQCIRAGVPTGKLFDVGCGYNQVLRKKRCGVQMLIIFHYFSGQVKILLMYHIACFHGMLVSLKIWLFRFLRGSVHVFIVSLFLKLLI